MLLVLNPSSAAITNHKQQQSGFSHVVCWSIKLLFISGVTSKVCLLHPCSCFWFWLALPSQNYLQASAELWIHTRRNACIAMGLSAFWCFWQNLEAAAATCKIDVWLLQGRWSLLFPPSSWLIDCSKQPIKSDPSGHCFILSHTIRDQDGRGRWSEIVLMGTRKGRTWLWRGEENLYSPKDGEKNVAAILRKVKSSGIRVTHSELNTQSNQVLWIWML